MNADVKSQNNRAVGAVSVTASVAALACGVCCVLPIAVIGSVGGALAWFSHAYSWMTVIACVAVVAGWAGVAWQSWRSGKRPAKSTLLVMAFATLIMGLAYMWPMFEGPIGALLKR